MKYIKLYEDFQLGDLNVMSPEEIQGLFRRECGRIIPDINLIRVIVENGLVDVNAKNRYGMSPLYWAVDRGNKQIEALLKKHGAVE